ncbi:hypothetical protein M426DRAFT_11752 [Hypoxylon sp. CI-4A]|nr:hypothetical protein M426DRAFT_11752 [Hypoxylon sp. CI-4A]
MAPTILITGATGLIGFGILLASLERGYNVRYTVRSEDKARIVSSNPAVRELAAGNRLSSIVIPDFTAEGAFDSAIKGATHIFHTSSPVALPTYEPTIDIFEPTTKISANLLLAALEEPSVQRIVITSSIVANLGLNPPSHTVSASTRAPLPDPFPVAFGGVYDAYILGKIVELHKIDQFVKAQNPHFTVSCVFPGYVFGRNELALDADMVQTQNGTNNFLIAGMLGGEAPMPIHGVFAHLDDVVEAQMRLAFPTPKMEALREFGIAAKVDYDEIFGYVEKAFPKAVAKGVFRKGNVSTLAVEYDSSDLATVLGGKARSFESAVVDVAAQYLEKLGLEKA